MKHTAVAPYAITMWDFSWLERRWPGAGYEDWDVALSELADRGYDAVRIDAYPHLCSADPDRTWEILPSWNQTSWGAQSLIHIQILPALTEFMKAARRHGVKVALSTWYREDRDNTRMNIRTPEDQARIWVDTLRHIEKAGLLDTILFVDLCNEFANTPASPYLYENLSDTPSSRTEPRIIDWMRESIEFCRASYPDLSYTYSFCMEYANWPEQDVTMLDLLEPHIWMANEVTSGYHKAIDYNYERFDPIGFDNIVKNGRREYESRKEHYDTLLFNQIDEIADWSRASQLGLVTTECWALVDYKDWPGLEWDWIMDLNARAVEYAASTGRWIGISTSNFCGPQFVEMWRNVEWHRRLTDVIKTSSLDADLLDTSNVE